MLKYKIRISIIILFALTVFGVPKSFADGGDFTLDFVAAAPQTYDHNTGGGAFNNDTSNSDTVESLEGGEFICADIVTHFVQISVAGGAAGSQTIQIDLQFAADANGQTGAGYGDVVSASINYGQVENGDDYSGTSPGAGVFGLDGGINDDRQDSNGDTGVGGSSATIVSEGFSGSGGLFSNDTYDATIEVDGLEAGEVVILRVDARLFCLPDSSPTGNVQANIDAARVTSPAPDTINVGKQTVSLGVGGGSGRPDQVDFSDLPNDIGGQPDFPTLASSDGARHLITAGLYLGACVDSETDGQPSAAVTGDDTGVGGNIQGTCVGNNDEDGVTFIEGLAGNGGGWSNGTVAGNNGGALTIVVTAGSGIPQVFLSNGSGPLLDVGTLYQSDGTPWSTPFLAGTYDVYFDLPAGFFNGTNNTDVYTRVRLSSAGGLAATGGAADGEVEDYIYNLSPTAISLQEFGVTQTSANQAWTFLGALLLLTISVLIFRRRMA